MLKSAQVKTPYFLVAPPHIAEHKLKQAVILLVDLDENGGFGFVLNHKSMLTIDQVLQEDCLQTIPSGLPVWDAGPAEPEMGFVLHNQPKSRYEEEISPGVCLSASQETLSKVIASCYAVDGARVHTPVLYPFRLLVGYTSWEAGQLEEELQRGQWLSAPLDRDILFNLDHQHMWHSLIAAMGITQSKYLPTAPGAWLH